MITVKTKVKMDLSKFDEEKAITWADLPDEFILARVKSGRFTTPLALVHDHAEEELTKLYKAYHKAIQQVGSDNVSLEAFHRFSARVDAAEARIGKLRARILSEAKSAIKER